MVTTTKSASDDVPLRSMVTVSSAFMSSACSRMIFRTSLASGPFFSAGFAGAGLVFAAGFAVVLAGALDAGLAVGFAAGLAGGFDTGKARVAPRGDDTLTDAFGVGLAAAMDGMRLVASVALLPEMV